MFIFTVSVQHNHALDIQHDVVTDERSVLERITFMLSTVGKMTN